MAEKRQRYEGPVVFVEGVHYPVGEDGHADLSRGGLRLADDCGWQFASDDAPLHNDVHHLQHVELDVGGED